MRPIIAFALVATLVIGVCMLVQLMRQPAPAGSPPPSSIPPHAEARSDGSVGHDAVMYVLDSARRQLKPVAISVLADATPAEGAVAIINELIRFSDDPANANAAPFPFGTRLKALTLDDDLAVVDFNEEFRDQKFWSGSEHEYLALRALVNSLTELAGIKRVQIKVNGKKVESLGGHEEISEPLRRDDATLPAAEAESARKKIEKSS